MRPVGWEKEGESWTKSFGDFYLRARSLGGLIGESWFHPHIEIHGNSQPIVVESAELRAHGGVYQPEVLEERKKVPAYCTSGCELGISWDFGRDHAAPEVLGDRCEIVLRLLAGSEKREISITLEQRR